MDFAKPFYNFRFPTDKNHFEKLKSLILDEVELKEKEPERGTPFLCRQCNLVITDSAEIIEVAGGHQHTFVNPEGIVFEIGCFRNAPGCGYVGPAREEFTWFKGFKWRVGVCRRCLTHIGWLYIARDKESFHGLILDRLVRSP